MWRGNYEEDWERRKAYLIRSFFRDDVAALSPVPEEEESFDSPPSQPPSAVVRQQPERPFSPLPPLIIEKEPNRHDEPIEYYRKLEKKVMKVYKRMFIEDRSDISDISDSTNFSVAGSKYCDRRASFGEANNMNDYIQTVDTDEINATKEIDHSSKDASKSIHVAKEKEKRSSTETLPKSTSDDLQTDIIHKEISSSTTDSPKCLSNNNKIKVTEKDTRSSSTEIIPRSSTDEMETYVLEEQRSSSTEISPSSSVYSNEEENFNSEHTQIASNLNKNQSFAENKSGTTETSSASYDGGYRQITFKADVHRDATEQIVQKAPSLIYEQNIIEENIIGANNILAELEENDISDGDGSQNIEVMRTQIMRMSAVSVQQNFYDNSHWKENEVRERPRSLEANSESNSSKESIPNVMDYEDSIDYDILHTSIINEEHCNKDVAPNNLTSRKRKTLSPLSSTKKAKYEDASVQANLEDDYLEDRILCDKIFVGVPRVFKLCSCANHLCSN